MRRGIWLPACVSAGVVAGLSTWAAPPPGQVREAAHARIALARTIAADPLIVEAVRRQNASGLSTDTVQSRDREWTRDPQYSLRRAMTDSPCSKRLRELSATDALVVEAIVMDAQGANVCVSRETTDYWQGDEAKFQRTFGADREAFVDEPALDASTGTFAIQVSVLQRDNGTKIGAVTLTLRVAAGRTPAS